MISLLCAVSDSFDSLFFVSVRGALGSFIPLLSPFFLPLTLVYNVKYVPKNSFSSLSNLPFTPLFLPFCRGEKCHRRQFFTLPRHFSVK